MHDLHLHNYCFSCEGDDVLELLLSVVMCYLAVELFVMKQR